MKVSVFRKYRRYWLLFVMFVFLHSLRYFDFIYLNQKVYEYLTWALAAFLIALCCLFRKKSSAMHSSGFLLAMILVPMLSIVPCFIENGQSPVDSLKAYLPFFLTFIYFILHYSRIRESDLVKMITILAVVRILIVVVQQVTFPSYLFSYRPEGFDASGVYREVEVRSGIYRFYVEDTYLSMFLVFYYFERYLRKHSLPSLLLCALGFVGIYFDQSRQFMLSTVAAFGIVLLFSLKMKGKWAVVLGVSVIAVLILRYAAALFGDLAEMTLEDIDEDNIRLVAYATYLLEIWGGPLSVIFGNGVPWKGAYADQMEYYSNTLRLYRADIGIVGALNAFGIVTVLVFLGFFIFFVGRNWKKLRPHLQMYYLAAIINMPMVTVYTQNINWFVFMAMMLYLSDISISSYDRKVRNKRKICAESVPA